MKPIQKVVSFTAATLLLLNLHDAGTMAISHRHDFSDLPDLDIDPDVFAVIDQEESKFEQRNNTQKLIQSIIQKHLKENQQKQDQQESNTQPSQPQVAPRNIPKQQQQVVQDVSQQQRGAVAQQQQQEKQSAQQSNQQQSQQPLQLSEEDEFMKPFVDLDNQAKLFEQMQEKEKNEQQQRAVIQEKKHQLQLQQQQQAAQLAREKQIKQEQQVAAEQQKQKQLLLRQQKQQQQQQAMAAIEKKIAEKKQQRIKAQQELVEKQKALETAQRKLVESAQQVKMEREDRVQQQQQQQQQQPQQVQQNNQEKIYEWVKKSEQQQGAGGSVAQNQQEMEKQMGNIIQENQAAQKKDSLESLYEKSQNLLSKANSLKMPNQASDQQQAAAVKQYLRNANESTMSQAEKEHLMAMKLSETFRILEQQEKRATEEKNDLGRGLFLKSQELLKATTDLTEEAGIKLAAAAEGAADESQVAAAQNQTAEAAVEGEKMEKVQQQVPQLQENRNISAMEMIKETLQKKDDEKKANETKLNQKDSLKDEILGSIMKVLDEKDKKKSVQSQEPQAAAPEQLVPQTPKPMPTQQISEIQSVVQQSSIEEHKEMENMMDAGKQAIISGQNTYVPHAVFRVGEAGSVQMSPFQSLSLDGELQNTHNQIIQLQNKMIEHKKKKLIEKSSDNFNVNTFSTGADDDGDGDFVDFGLVGLHEQGFEQQEQKVEETNQEKLHRYLRAPASQVLLQLAAEDDDANKTHVIFHKGKAQIVPATQKVIGESPRLAEPYTFMILSLDTRTGQGIFKMKQYNRTHLSEMREMFEDVVEIKSNNSQVIMVGNGKLINKTQGGFDDPQIQALIGKAIQKKFIPFSYKPSGENSAAQAQNATKEAAERFALSVKQGKLEELPLDNAEVKKALHKKEKAAANKKSNGKGKEKKEKVSTAACKEPEVLVDSVDGSILKLCSNTNISEWRSLALLGKLALQDKANTHRTNYNQMFQSEPQIGLKLYSEIKKGE